VVEHALAQWHLARPAAMYEAGRHYGKKAGTCLQQLHGSCKPLMCCNVRALQLPVIVICWFKGCCLSPCVEYHQQAQQSHTQSCCCEYCCCNR
jgi:hypothetical protein